MTFFPSSLPLLGETRTLYILRKHWIVYITPKPFLFFRILKLIFYDKENSNVFLDIPSFRPVSWLNCKHAPRLKDLSSHPRIHMMEELHTLPNPRPAINKSTPITLCFCNIKFITKRSGSFDHESLAMSSSANHSKVQCLKPTATYLSSSCVIWRLAGLSWCL